MHKNELTVNVFVYKIIISRCKSIRLTTVHIKCVLVKHLNCSFSAVFICYSTKCQWIVKGVITHLTETQDLLSSFTVNNKTIHDKTRYKAN